MVGRYWMVEVGHKGDEYSLLSSTVSNDVGDQELKKAERPNK